jgi:hypothetical protein
MRKWCGGLALALVVLAAGCGSDDSSTETTAALSKAAFVREADAICRENREKIIKAAAKIPLQEKPEAREAVERKLISSLLIPGLEEVVDRIRDLGPPPSGEAQIERILVLTENAIEEAETEPETYVAGENYRDGSVRFGEANRLARGYGMKSCLARGG